MTSLMVHCIIDASRVPFSYAKMCPVDLQETCIKQPWELETSMHHECSPRRKSGPHNHMRRFGAKTVG